jgi:hypothetical protein
MVTVRAAKRSFTRPLLSCRRNIDMPSWARSSCRATRMKVNASTVEECARTKLATPAARLSRLRCWQERQPGPKAPPANGASIGIMAPATLKHFVERLRPVFDDDGYAGRSDPGPTSQVAGTLV